MSKKKKAKDKRESAPVITGHDERAERESADRRLWQRLADQSAIAPSLVRETARGVAAEGLAGREAAASVAAARGEDGAARMRTNFLLLLDLVMAIFAVAAELGKWVQ